MCTPGLFTQSSGRFAFMPTYLPIVHPIFLYRGSGFMNKKLYVGNLPYSATEAQIRDLFEQAGEIESVALITDRETGRPKGFGFVEMATPEGAQEAIKRFNGF